MGAEQIIGGGFILFVFLLGVYCAYRYLSESARYKAHPRNPYIRICRKCGEEQHQYENSFGGTWWVSYGHPINASCDCHNDTECRDY